MSQRFRMPGEFHFLFAGRDLYWYSSVSEPKDNYMSLQLSGACKNGRSYLWHQYHLDDISLLLLIRNCLLFYQHELDFQPRLR